MINKGDILICKETHQGFIKDYHYEVYYVKYGIVNMLNENTEVCGFYNYLDTMDDRWHRTWYLWNTFYKISELRKLKLKQINES